VKKLIYLGVLIMVGALIYSFIPRRPVKHVEALALYSKDGLGPDKAAVYQVSLTATQKSKGQEDKIIASVSGRLEQVEQAPGVYLSQWLEIDKLTTGEHLASPAESASVIKKTIMTSNINGELNHYFDKAFPKDWFRMQLNVMQRFFVAVPTNVGPKFQRKEKEELGEYAVEYDIETKGDHREIAKKWINYESPDIEMDKTFDTVYYFVGKEGRIIGIDGATAFTHQQINGDQFVITLTVDLLSVSPKTNTTALVEEASLAKADDQKIQEVARETTAASTIGYDEAVKRLQGITSASDSRDVYLIFAALKAELRTNPERANELRETILATTARDDGAKRQLAAVFGAMAQSDQSSVANVLADLATQCKDVFCKDQAIVALNDHSQPTASSGKKMLELVKSKPDHDTTAAAVLAAGSIAYKINDQLPEVPAALISAYKDPANQLLKRSVIAAMGNHGSSEYLPVLKETLGDKESMVRATSLYSLRNIKAPEVNEILTAAIEREKDGDTMVEGLKAMVYREMSPAEYQRVASKVASLQDKDNANEATRFLIKAYERNPQNLEAAMIQVKDKTTIPTVKSAIERELKPDAN
jgi:hypothetical protein